VDGPGMVRAGWPESNGSVMGTSAAALDGAVMVTVAEAAGAVALLLLAALAVAVVPGVALLPVDELEPLQPASTPIPMADTAAMASLSPAPPRLPLPIGRPRPDCPMSLPLAPGHRRP
jgi:hypothetical protein